MWDNKSPFDNVYFLGNISAKNHQNQLMWLEVTVRNISVVLF